MRIPAKLSNLYSGLAGRERFYIRARWLLSPISLVEREIPAEGKIYDAGCGVGLLANLAAIYSQKRKIIGIDSSEKKISIAKKSVGSRTNISFERGDVLNFVFQKPDVIVMCDLLHHMHFRDQVRFLEHVYNSLSSKGMLIIQDIDKSPAHKYLFALTVDKIFNKMAKAYYRKSMQLADILKATGFKVETEKSDKGYPIACVLFKCRKS